MLLHKVLLRTAFLEKLKDGISAFFRKQSLLLDYFMDITIGVLYYHQWNNGGNFCSFTKCEHCDA